MWKKVLVLSTAAMLVGSAAFAQQPNMGRRDGIPEIQPWRPSAYSLIICQEGSISGLSTCNSASRSRNAAAAPNAILAA